MDYGILSVMPPLIAFGIVIWKKELIPALLLGIFGGKVIIAHGDVVSAFVSTLDNILTLIMDKSNLQIILFSLFVGGLLNLMKEANGFIGFLNWCKSKKTFNNEKAVYPLTYVLNISMFIDSWSSILITGSLMRSIYAKFNISRERLAYFLHTISINFVALVILNSWGAYYLSVLSTQNVDNPLDIILRSIPLNFYCIGSLVLVILVMATKWTIGPMKKAEALIQDNKGERVPKGLEDLEISKSIKPEAKNLILPVLTLIFFVFLGLYISGNGSIIKGSGSVSLFNAVCITIGLTAFYFSKRKLMNYEKITAALFKGMADLLPIGVLLALAFAIGDICQQVGTGNYLSAIVKDSLPIFMVPAIAFGISCVMSFSTGTSWGTIAIMVPIVIPIALTMQINPALMFGACIGGGVFGDNCSPLSDTSILTGMVTEIQVVDHIKTQIPYALIVASFSIVLYLIIGALQ